MKGRKTKALIAGLVALCVASMSLLGIIWHREGYTRKVLIKLGLTTEKDPGRDHNALLSWQASLESMNYKADVAFFGDSITKNNRWQDYFPGIAVCNLGYSGDTVAGLLERTGMVQAVNPDKVFILIGVNNMGKGRYLENLSQGYRQLIAQLQSGLPQAQLFMVSILPTCPPSDLSNQQILEANRMIQQLAQELDIPISIPIANLRTSRGSWRRPIPRTAYTCPSRARTCWPNVWRLMWETAPMFLIPAPGSRRRTDEGPFAASARADGAEKGEKSFRWASGFAGKPKVSPQNRTPRPREPGPRRAAKAARRGPGSLGLGLRNSVRATLRPAGEWPCAESCPIRSWAVHPRTR